MYTKFLSTHFGFSAVCEQFLMSDNLTRWCAFPCIFALQDADKKIMT